MNSSRPSQACSKADRNVPRIAYILILLAVACSAFATDYQVSINASVEQLAKAKAIRVYGFKFAKGDHIVAVVGGREAAEGNVQVSLDSAVSSGTVLSDSTSLQGFGGKVIASGASSPES